MKETSRGGIELRLGRSGRLVKAEVKMPEIDEIKDDFDVIKAKNISDLHEEEYVEVKASLVQVFNRSPFFEVCPKCELRLEKDGGRWKCKEHGKVEPKYNMILSGVVDDGTGNVRVVFFRELAEKVFGMDVASLRKVALDGNETAKILYRNSH